MGISTIPMSVFVLKSQQREGAALFLYLGLGLASSYIDPYQIWIGCSAGAATPCCGCGGGGSRRLIEAEAGATRAICVECVDWKRRGDN